ncbi:alpha/beta-hydrolase [Wolfiporia cocos MD-104 SS10]|uniref:Alpha/beta-hydrolase n=1 Tax=Wolfiporia cocos (strain MD-104) TaxID=742152 RepID=A0A2H3IYX6_WOLCO|nr:alpha/beta-hydrolase [Wolfiporia cocos MD-104 SS10]
MANRKIAPYGTWSSPITTDAILQSGGKPSEVFVDPITSTIYHVEGRPYEAGRSVIVRTQEGHDAFGKGWNARTGVQEYGGAPAIAYDGTIYFSNFTDNRVYKFRDGEEPIPVTPGNKNLRFANFSVHPTHPYLLVAILEDHTRPAPPDVITTLCTINTQSCTVSPLVSGADFYGYPVFSPDGTSLAWQQWLHPDMPWEGAEIYVASISASSSGITISNATYVAGKKIAISACAPAWASSDVLLFTSDESGYQNPWTYSISQHKAAPVLPAPVDEEFSLPVSGVGRRYGVPLDDTGDRALYAAVRDDRSVLYVLDLRRGAAKEVDSPYAVVSAMQCVRRDAVAFLGTRVDAPTNIVLITLPGDEPLHVLYLPPHNPAYVAPDGERPPCVVNAHGGPTGRQDMSLDWAKQFFTTRGWAWLDVNYGGSSGYGRKYVERLAGTWGVVDVADSVRALHELSSPPYSLVDPRRAAIRGGSAGGYTTLATLCARPDAFAAATSLFGIADLRSLTTDTHKFESHYMEKLMGGTIEEIPAVYEERSPVLHAEEIRTPLLVLQGSIDAVVPPSQAEVIVKAIKDRGGRVEYTLFEGEGHGWRKADTVKAALEQELHFYEDVLGIKAM